MKLKCTKEVEGFTVGKKYKVRGCVAEYVLLKDDNKREVVIYEGYFEPVNFKKNLISILYKLV